MNEERTFQLNLLPPFKEGGLGLIGNLDRRVYSIECEFEGCYHIPQSFVRKHGYRNKTIFLTLSPKSFIGSQEYWLESNGWLTDEGFHSESISYTFEEFIGLVTGKRVVRGDRRTRKKIHMRFWKSNSDSF
jgi:hypothetical protein